MFSCERCAWVDAVVNVMCLRLCYHMSVGYDVRLSVSLSVVYSSCFFPATLHLNYKLVGRGTCSARDVLVSVCRCLPSVFATAHFYSYSHLSLLVAMRCSPSILFRCRCGDLLRMASVACPESHFDCATWQGLAWNTVVTQISTCLPCKSNCAPPPPVTYRVPVPRSWETQSLCRQSAGFVQAISRKVHSVRSCTVASYLKFRSWVAHLGFGRCLLECAVAAFGTPILYLHGRESNRRRYVLSWMSLVERHRVRTPSCNAPTQFAVSVPNVTVSVSYRTASPSG